MSEDYILTLPDGQEVICKSEDAFEVEELEPSEEEVVDHKKWLASIEVFRKLNPLNL